MTSIFDFHPDDFKNLKSRRIRPLIPAGLETPLHAARFNLSLRPDTVSFRSLQAPAEPPPSALNENDLKSIWTEVQGDVFEQMPKEAENFIFFVINDVAQFKNDLKSFKPTSSLDVVASLKKISEAKGQGRRAPVILSQIAFGRAGLNALGQTGEIKDPRFDTRPMLKDKDFLGDLSGWFTPFKEGNLHGVFSIAASSVQECDDESARIKSLFAKSITTNEKMTLKGRVRPGANRGHEHFGYEDGVSQPSLRGLGFPHTGQLEADPGVVIMGYKGDPVYDDPKAPQRPAWATNGSFLVIRQLEQDVPEFDVYIKRRGKDWKKFVHGADVQPPLTDEEGAELFGAQMIGRWKSGVPLQTYPYRDDPSVADDKDKLNDFDYSVPGVSEPSDRFCPFTAHTRKTAPRNLSPFMQQKFLESALVVRTGIPYGPEVTPEERNAGVSLKDDAHYRGLVFTCYQSSLDNGFVRQTKAFAGNDYFPVTGFAPTKHGQDPILGAPAASPTSVAIQGEADVPANGEVAVRVKNKEGKLVDIAGFARPADLAADADPQQFFVTSRGGEYFFVPSVSFVKELAQGTSASHELDIVFLQDATGSMKPYIQTVRDKIGTILDKIANSPKLQQKSLDVRFGLVAFRDYEPQDYSMLTHDYGFTSDPAVVKDYLSKLISKGGGDGPEAQTAALAVALKTNWRKDAMKMVILVTDSPPHAIGEDDDYFTQGTPDNEDPINITNIMAQQGITLNVVACETTLSSKYDYAHDFYRELAEKTHGQMIPLLQSEKLVDCIIGCALQHADIESLVCQCRNDVKDQYNKTKNIDDVVNKFQAQFSAANITVNTLDVEDIYVDTDRSRRNREAWRNAKNLAEGRANVRRVEGSRIQSKFQWGGADHRIQVTQEAPTLSTTRRVVARALYQ